MKKIASLLMGFVMLASTSFSQEKQDAKTVNKTKTTKHTTSVKTTPDHQPAAASATISTTTKTKKDGTPDKRYKENKASATTISAGPVKKDGTPDKRYKKNKAQ